MDRSSSPPVFSLSESMVMDVTYDMSFSTSSPEWISVPIVEIDSCDIEVIRAVARAYSIKPAKVQLPKTENDESSDDPHAVVVSDKEEAGREQGKPKVDIAKNKESTAVSPYSPPRHKKQKTELEDCSEESGLPAN